jgi:hypothetical protein
VAREEVFDEKNELERLVRLSLYGKVSMMAVVILSILT